jgi:hypothetical protein
MDRIYQIVIICLLLGCTNACQDKNELEKKFNCDKTEIGKLKRTFDFNKNFSLNIPMNWKSNFFYSSSVSEIFIADTTKQLSESYIFNASFHIAELNFDTDFHKKTDSLLLANNMEMVASEKLTFMEKESYWYLVEGEKNGFPVHQFNFMMKRNHSTYFSSSTEIYGDKEVYERLCSSFYLLKSVEFFE